MHYREIFRILSQYCLGFTLLIFIPLGVAVYHDFFISHVNHLHPHTTEAFLGTMGVALGFSLLFNYLGKGSRGIIYRREGLILVVAIWVLTPFISMLPFLFSGTLERPVQAYFEAVSGLTTTGSTVLQAKHYDPLTQVEVPVHNTIHGEFDTEYIFYGTVTPIRDSEGKIIHHGIEAVSKSILFWRSFIQWIGGVGIIVLFIAVLPALGVGGKVLFQAESPGPIKETLTPRLIETAGLLWKLYLALTGIQVVLLIWSDPQMTLFEAICTSFSTLSTGGFSVRNYSIGSYNNFYTYWIVMLFMFLGSINFSLYFHLLRGKFLRLKDPELIVYICVVLFAGCFSSYWLYGTGKAYFGTAGGGFFSLWEAITHGFFQVISAQTSTGFATANYDKWPYAVQVLLLILMFVGGMSGSTAGGMKMMRHVMIFRIIQNKLELLFRPSTVRVFRIGKKEVSSHAAQTVLCFFAVFMVFSVLGTLIFIVDGIDPETALSLVSSSINNGGFSFRGAGPTESCAFLSTFSCLWACFLMILGRLELFALLVVMVPGFWKPEA